RVAVLALDLEVGEHGLAARTPVDDVVVAVDEAFLVEPHERLADRAGQARIHREALAPPVAGRTETLQPADDRSARLFLPRQHPREESVVTEVFLGLPFPVELTFP